MTAWPCKPLISVITFSLPFCCQLVLVLHRCHSLEIASLELISFQFTTALLIVAKNLELVIILIESFIKKDSIKTYH